MSVDKEVEAKEEDLVAEEDEECAQTMTVEEDTATAEKPAPTSSTRAE